MIIRDSQSSVAVSAEAFQFEDLQQKADAYLNKVRQQAEEIQRAAQTELESWRKETIDQVQSETESLRLEAQRLYDQAQKQGYEKGFDQGLQEARNDIQGTVKKHLDERLDKAFPAIDAALDQLEAKEKQWTAQWESAGIRLAMAVAEKILRSELTTHPEKILPALREALELTAQSHSIHIRLSQDDYETLLPEINALLEKFQRVGKTEIVSDPALLSGDCVVETPMGEIDMQIKSQLERIAEELT